MSKTTNKFSPEVRSSNCIIPEFVELGTDTIGDLRLLANHGGTTTRSRARIIAGLSGFLS